VPCVTARAPTERSAASIRTAALLTVCSQTVRILLDVAAHVHGKWAGQVHNGGCVGTSWDRLVGFKSRHPDHHGARTAGASISHRTRVEGAGQAVLACPTTSRKALTDQPAVAIAADGITIN
jgi:hypothetical protein